MGKFFGIEIEPIENFVKANFDLRFSLFKKKIPKKLKNSENIFNSILDKPLTYRQKIAVILDEKRNLVVAGAGTGKTTTIVAKVLYLVKSGLCKENKILVLAYARDARNELQDRIKALGLKNVDVKTFHSLGRSINSSAYNIDPSVSKLAQQPFKLAEYIDNTLQSLLEKNIEFRDNFVEFTFFNKIETYEKRKERKLNSVYEYSQWQSNNKLFTLKNEKVKSFSELSLANYFLLQGIEYKYEANHVNEKKYNPDFFLTNYNVYVELWGIDSKGNTAPHINNKKYLKDMEEKKLFHKRNNTKLIEVFYYEMQEKYWKKIIDEKLEKFKIKKKPLNTKQIKKVLFEFQNRQSKIDKYKTFTTFLKLFKSHESLTFKELRNMAIGDTRINNFLDIFESFYIEYQDKLKKNGEIDFEDMINNASNAVREGMFKAPWEYIIIDEFQDCSWGQYRLLRNILHQSNKDKKKILGNNDNIQGPKLYCVGDDWQSIFRFAGADYNLMLDFRKYLGIKKFLLNSYTRINLDETFRFNDKIAYTSEKFILENKNQIKKNIKTTIKANDPAVFLHWSSVSLDNKILNWLKDYSENKNYKNKNLMILFRYNFHEPSLEMKNIIRQKWKKNGSVDFKTCHKAKGLESDIVLLIDLQSGESGGNGFPSTKEDDPIIDLLLVKSDDYPFAEERRLFYVVLTRARFQTHLLCDSINISDFAKELRDEEKFKTVSREQKSVDHAKAIPF